MGQQRGKGIKRYRGGLEKIGSRCSIKGALSGRWYSWDCWECWDWVSTDYPA